MSSGIFAVHIPDAAQGEVVRFIRATLAYKRCHLRLPRRWMPAFAGMSGGESVARMERSEMRDQDVPRISMHFIRATGLATCRSTARNAVDSVRRG